MRRAIGVVVTALLALTAAPAWAQQSDAQVAQNLENPVYSPGARSPRRLDQAPVDQPDQLRRLPGDPPSPGRRISLALAGNVYADRGDSPSAGLRFTATYVLPR